MANAAEKPRKITKTELDALKPKAELYRVWDTEITGFHVRVSPKGLITFAQRYHHNGMNHNYTIGRYGPLTLVEARREAIKARSKALTEHIDLTAQKKQLKKSTKWDALSHLGGFYTEKYLPWAEGTFREKGVYELKRVMDKEFKYLMKYRLDEITPLVVDQYLQKVKRTSKDLSPSTINRRIVILKALLNKAVTWDVLPKSRLAGYKMLKVDKQPITRVLSQEEEVAMRAALDQRQNLQREERDSFNAWAKERKYPLKPSLSQPFTDYLYPIVLTALNTGMRKGEVFNLTWERVDFGERVLTIDGATSKSGNTRIIPLNDELFKTLKQWQAQTTHTGLVFPSTVTKGRLDNINQVWRALMKAAKIKDFRFHDLRHSFASRLARAGADLNTVRELMGHASIEMTLRYSHTNMDNKKLAVNLLDGMRAGTAIKKSKVKK